MNGTKACIDDCTAFGFPFFKDCVYDHIPRTSSKAAGYSEEYDQQDKDVCLEGVNKYSKIQVLIMSLTTLLFSKLQGLF